MLVVLVNVFQAREFRSIRIYYVFNRYKNCRKYLKRKKMRTEYV